MRLERRVDPPGHELATPARVDFELLDTLGQRPEVLKEELARIPGALEVAKGPGFEEAMNRGAGYHQHVRRE